MMINTLDDYIGQSMPRCGGFETNPNLRKKVSEDGKLLPYIGNTAVFLLDEETKQNLQKIQETLFLAAPDMLAEKLQTATFHMTLHDLTNGSPDQWGLEDAMKETEAYAAGMISGWKDWKPLHMKATWLFNMVNTSIVLGLAPADKDTWNRLDEMYLALESVVSLGYALTPHITMAYYRPGRYSQEQVSRLSAVLQKVDLEITLHLENLVLQNFTDMNHYNTIA